MTNTLKRRSFIFAPLAAIALSGLDCLLQVEPKKDEEIKLPNYTIERSKVVEQQQTIMAPTIALIPASNEGSFDFKPYHDFFLSKYTALTLVSMDPPSPLTTPVITNIPIQKSASFFTRKIFEKERIGDNAIVLVTHGNGLLTALEYASSFPDQVYSIVSLDPSHDCMNADTSQALVAYSPKALKKVGLIVRSTKNSPENDPVVATLEAKLDEIRNSHYRLVKIPEGGSLLSENVSEKIDALNYNPLSYITFRR